jgi:hypothetical protein
MLALLSYYRGDTEPSRTEGWLMRWPWRHRNWQPQPRLIEPRDLSPHLLRDIGLWDAAADNGYLQQPSPGDQAPGISNSRPHCGC